jgi:hypothetical protein
MRHESAEGPGRSRGKMQERMYIAVRGCGLGICLGRWEVGGLFIDEEFGTE